MLARGEPQKTDEKAARAVAVGLGDPASGGNVGVIGKARERLGERAAQALDHAAARCLIERAIRVLGGRNGRVIHGAEGNILS